MRKRHYIAISSLILSFAVLFSAGYSTFVFDKQFDEEVGNPVDVLMDDIKENYDINTDIDQSQLYDVYFFPGADRNNLPTITEGVVSYSANRNNGHFNDGTDAGYKVIENVNRGLTGDDLHDIGIPLTNRKDGRDYGMTFVGWSISRAVVENGHAYDCSGVFDLLNTNYALDVYDNKDNDGVDGQNNVIFLYATYSSGKEYGWAKDNKNDNYHSVHLRTCDSDDQETYNTYASIEKLDGITGLDKNDSNNLYTFRNVQLDAGSSFKVDIMPLDITWVLLGYVRNWTAEPVIPSSDSSSDSSSDITPKENSQAVVGSYNIYLYILSSWGGYLHDELPRDKISYTFRIDNANEQIANYFVNHDVRIAYTNSNSPTVVNKSNGRQVLSMTYFIERIYTFKFLGGNITHDQDSPTGTQTPINGSFNYNNYAAPHAYFAPTSDPEWDYVYYNLYFGNLASRFNYGTSSFTKRIFTIAAAADTVDYSFNLRDDGTKSFLQVLSDVDPSYVQGFTDVDSSFYPKLLIVTTVGYYNVKLKINYDTVDTTKISSIDISFLPAPRNISIKIFDIVNNPELTHDADGFLLHRIEEANRTPNYWTNWVENTFKLTELDFYVYGETTNPRKLSNILSSLPSNQKIFDHLTGIELDQGTLDLIANGEDTKYVMKNYVFYIAPANWKPSWQGGMR